MPQKKPADASKRTVLQAAGPASSQKKGLAVDAALRPRSSSKLEGREWRPAHQQAGGQSYCGHKDINAGQVETGRRAGDGDRPDGLRQEGQEEKEDVGRGGNGRSGGRGG